MFRESFDETYQKSKFLSEILPLFTDPFIICEVTDVGVGVFLFNKDTGTFVKIRF